MHNSSVEWKFLNILTDRGWAVHIPEGLHVGQAPRTAYFHGMHGQLVGFHSLVVVFPSGGLWIGAQIRRWDYKSKQTCRPPYTLLQGFPSHQVVKTVIDRCLIFKLNRDWPKKMRNWNPEYEKNQSDGKIITEYTQKAPIHTKKVRGGYGKWKKFHRKKPSNIANESIY